MTVKKRCKNCNAEFDATTVQKACSVECRLMSNMELEDNCWIWKGMTGTEGYGEIRINSKKYTTHKASYELYMGKIGKGYRIYHHCKNRRCFNPFHLKVYKIGEKK